jgi:hypothetical protein
MSPSASWSLNILATITGCEWLPLQESVRSINARILNNDNLRISQFRWKFFGKVNRACRFSDVTKYIDGRISNIVYIQKTFFVAIKNPIFHK